ncbi:MAG: AAA family ATPase [Alphaproteobacteria bacterium]
MAKLKNPTAKIIGIVQVKGGAGRSTVATNVAGELSKVGKTVLIDCDMPQGTAASWVAVRQQNDQPDLFGGVQGDTATSHRELLDKVERWRGEADYIVLDGPPRIAELTRAILVLSDLALVPVGASVAELWATGDVVEIVRQAREVRPVDVRILWTRFRGYTRLAQDLAAQAKPELGLPILKTAMGLRVAYVEALGIGRTAAELSDATARTELKELIAEIRRIIR